MCTHKVSDMLLNETQTSHHNCVVDGQHAAVCWQYEGLCIELMTRLSLIGDSKPVPAVLLSTPWSSDLMLCVRVVLLIWSLVLLACGLSFGWVYELLNCPTSLVLAPQVGKVAGAVCTTMCCTRCCFTGSVTGVGLEITYDDGAAGSDIVVLTPTPGGPGDKAGVHAGDVIVAVDGTPTKGLSLYDVSDLLQGEADSQVCILEGWATGRVMQSCCCCCN